MSAKKEDLLHVAEMLFYDQGFHAIGLKKVVSESGIAMMTLYNHFPSKEHLILEVLKRREERYMDHLRFFIDFFEHHGDEEYSSSDDGPRSPFLRIAAAHCRWLNDYAAKGCLFLRAKEEYGAEPEHPIASQVDAYKHRLREFVQATEPSRSPDEALRLCLLLEGATAMAESEPLENVTRETLFMAERLFA